MYVFSVRTFVERINHVRTELERHGIPFEFIFDFDPEDLAAPRTDGIEVCDLGPAHQSLVLKHIHAWRLACERGQRRILVFEDDVLLRPQFSRALAEALMAVDALPSSWLIFLGGADTKVPRSFFQQPGPLIAQPIATAEAYVTDLSACRQRLAWCAANQVRLPADHLIGSILTSAYPNTGSAKPLLSKAV